MQRYEIQEDIWWVGAIDWDVRDFHGYETPRGTTYNSYLITDEKMALIDGTREGFGSEVLRRVGSCCRLSQIDYLVINHVEPDHSGDIPWLIEQLAPVKVVTSKRAREILRWYYGAQVDGWDIQIVGTGDEVSLGKYTLTFLEAPMLHWPDSMFTYVKEAKVLLPNDAFGQHLATSKRFADEVDMSIVMDEAAKYYANILMLYGGQVQKIIAKVADMGLEIDVIGPSHGVVWRRPEDIKRIIEAYMAWSRGEARQRVALVYDTMWHSTEKMTLAIEDGIAQEGVEAVVLRLSRTPLAEIARAVLESRAFLVGSPTLNNTMFPTVGGFLTYIRGLRPKDRISGAYGSYGWSGGGVKQIDVELKSMNLTVLPPLEFRYVPTEEDIAACVEYGREVARQVKEWGKGLPEVS